jgi:hypothetical protein
VPVAANHANVERHGRGLRRQSAEISEEPADRFRLSICDGSAGGEPPPSLTEPGSRDRTGAGSQGLSLRLTTTCLGRSLWARSGLAAAQRQAQFGVA